MFLIIRTILRTRHQTVCQKYNFWRCIFLVLANVSADLDERITVLEENGGSDGNSPVAELEVRVETLEQTTENQ